jgi:hypothetical protein
MYSDVKSTHKFKSIDRVTWGIYRDELYGLNDTPPREYDFNTDKWALMKDYF